MILVTLYLIYYTMLPGAKTCLFANIFQGTIDDNTPVAKHIRGYTIRNTLTKDSMIDNHTTQGITKGVGIKAKAITNILHDRKLDSTVEGLSQMVNPARSGIWDEKGYFNEARFNDLKMMSIFDQGESIITKDIYSSFMEDIHKGKDYGKSTCIYYVLPVSWNRVTQGSIDELFEFYSDHTFINTKGRFEKALTIGRLYEFYNDPDATKRRRERLIE
jgi:hypothetical protein